MYIVYIYIHIYAYIHTHLYYILPLLALFDNYFYCFKIFFIFK